MIEKRKLHGRVNESLSEQQIHKSNAIVHTVSWKPKLGYTAHKIQTTFKNFIAFFISKYLIFQLFSKSNQQF